MDVSDDVPPENPAKRGRVAFHPDVQVQVMASWEKGLPAVRDEVRVAVEKHKSGDDAGYDAIKEVFSTGATASDAPSSTTLTNYILALIGVASRLDKSCAGLVHAILATDWVVRNESFVALYVQFLGNLVSAQGGYVGAALTMLVGNLVDRMYRTSSPLHTC